MNILQIQPQYEHKYALLLYLHHPPKGNAHICAQMHQKKVHLRSTKDRPSSTKNFIGSISKRELTVAVERSRRLIAESNILE
jgi:hypothetical protein